MRFIKLWVWIENLSFVAAVAFAVLQILYPSGGFAPWLGLFGLVAGSGFVRRLKSHSNEIESLGKLSPDALIRDLEKDELSRVLPRIARYARTHGKDDLLHWVTLEVGGYDTDNGMQPNETVPASRTIAVQHLDEYMRPLIIRNSSLSFINETRLRNGVAELETFGRSHQPMLYLQDVGTNEIIQEHLKARVVQSCFTPASVRGVLDRIRMDGLERLHKIEARSSNKRSSESNELSQR